MLQDIAEFIKPREERIEFAGRKLIVREAAYAADLGIEKGDPDSIYKLMVACVFLEDGTPALSKDDIPLLKAGGMKRVADIAAAVTKVNGLDVEAEAKKSEPGQG